jgi:Ni,Fe-hydrogenase III component G
MSEDPSTPATPGAESAASPASAPTEEERLITSLVKAFPVLEGKFTVQRARRVWAEAPLEDLPALIAYCKAELEFPWLCTITGTDEGDAGLGLIYHLARDTGLMLNITVVVPRDTEGPATITGLYSAAELYEREVVDLLGVRITGLPPGSRYPLPDDWPDGQYPLRKDWKPDADGNPGPAVKGANTEASK